MRKKNVGNTIHYTEGKGTFSIHVCSYPHMQWHGKNMPSQSEAVSKQKLFFFGVKIKHFPIFLIP